MEARQSHHLFNNGLGLLELLLKGSVLRIARFQLLLKSIALILRSSLPFFSNTVRPSIMCCASSIRSFCSVMVRCCCSIVFRSCSISFDRLRIRSSRGNQIQSVGRITKRLLQKLDFDFQFRILSIELLIELLLHENTEDKALR